MPCRTPISVQGAALRHAPCQWQLLHFRGCKIQWLSSPLLSVSFTLFMSHPVFLWPSVTNYMTTCLGQNYLEKYHLWLEEYSIPVFVFFSTKDLLPSIFRESFKNTVLGVCVYVLRQCVSGGVCVLFLLISHVPQMRAECFDDSSHYVVLWRASERWGKDEDVKKASKCKQTRAVKVRNLQEMGGGREKVNFNIYSQLC